METRPLMMADPATGVQEQVGEVHTLQIATHECNYHGIEFIVLQAQGTDGKWYDLAKISLEQLALDGYRFPAVIKLSLKGQTLAGSLLSPLYAQSGSPEQV